MDKIKDRIEILINKENLGYTQFARMIGIQSTIISHIMNGRNKPSLDVIGKIMNKFPTINPDWLILGKGNMYKNEEQTSEYKQITQNLGDSQLDFTEIFDTDSTNQSEYSKENELNITSENNHTVSNEIITEAEEKNENKTNYTTTINHLPENNNQIKTKEENSFNEIPPKKIKKIVIFYSDQSYEEFSHD